MGLGWGLRFSTFLTSFWRCGGFGSGDQNLPSRAVVTQSHQGLRCWGSQDQPLPLLPCSPSSCLASGEGLTRRPCFLPLSLEAPRSNVTYPSPLPLQPALVHFLVVFNNESIDKQPDLAVQILVSALFSSTQRSLFLTENKGLCPPLAYVSISCSMLVYRGCFFLLGQHWRGPLLGSPSCLLTYLDGC